MNLSVARRAPSWFQLAAWALCGASGSLVFLGAFTVGPFAAVPTAVFAGVALLAGGANFSAVGAAAGVGPWAFVLGWLNRDGPGQVCVTSGSSYSCTEEFTPWPSFVAGVVMIAASVSVFVILRRRSAMRLAHVRNGRSQSPLR